MKKTISHIFICALALFFIAIFNSICFNGAKKATAVLESMDSSVELKATITGSEMFTEIDEGTEREYWHAKVTYVYEGVTYNDIFYDSMDKEPTIGKEVSVKIDPDSPDRLLPDSGEFVLSLILSPLFLSAITIALFSIIDFIITSIAKQKIGLFSKIIAGMFVLIKLAAESLVFYIKHDSFVFAVFSLIAICLSTLILKFYHSSRASDSQEPQNS